MKTDLSIIIVNWNGIDITRQCLKSIYEQTKNINFEVIVIDNGSTDSSCQMIRDEFKQVKLISNTENKGFAAANNQGIEVSKGKFILLLNNDTVILENAIEKTLNFAKSNPQAGAVSCRVLNPDRTHQSTCFMFPSLLNLTLAALHLDKIFKTNSFFGRERYAGYDWNKTNEVDVITGCFMMVQREAIEEVGILDEQYFMYAEEADWCFRFKKAGWKILNASVGQIIHFGGVSSKKIKGAMMLQLKGSILLFIKKHRGKLSYVTSCAVTSLYFVIRSPYHFIRGNITGFTCWKGAFLSLLGADFLCLKR